MFPSFILLALSLTSGNCVLTEGVGADFGRVGVTRQEKAGLPPHGVRLEYKDHTLAQIFVYEGNCQTSRGVRVGDSQSKVQKLYGNGNKTTVEIKKGEGDSLGKLGDFVLEYPGVAFVISKGRVAALFITANAAEGVESRH